MAFSTVKSFSSKISTSPALHWSQNSEFILCTEDGVIVIVSIVPQLPNFRLLTSYGMSFLLRVQCQICRVQGSHQRQHGLVMHTTPLPFLKKSGPLATLHKGMWMRTRLISNQKITYIQLVSSPIYSGTG